MPGPLDCIILKAKDGLVSEKKVDELMELIDDLRNNGATGSDIALAQRALDIIRRRLNKKIQQTSLQAARQAEIQAKAQQNPTNVKPLMKAYFTFDLRGKYRDVLSFESAQKDVVGSAHALWSKGLETYTRKWLGLVSPKAGLRNLVREIFAEDTGDKVAREIADAWRSVDEYLVARHNNAGGDLTARKDWGLPQHHNEMKVRSVSKDEWIDETLNYIDSARMIDNETGLAFTPEKLRKTMGEVYDNIESFGMNALSPTAKGGRKLANRRTDGRFLIFKDAESWLKYQERFGDDDIFATLVGHIDSMGRDIALMETLGPNPDATVEMMRKLMRKDQPGRADSRILGRPTDDPTWEFDAIYNKMTGRTETPVSGRFADASMGLRNVLQSAQLGGAFLSALTDINFLRMAAKFSGLSQTRVMSRLLREFGTRPVSKENTRFAVQLGLVAEEWASTALAQVRFVGELYGPKFTRRLADAVMRGTLLSPWTEAGRHAFGKELLGFLSRMSRTPFDKLPTNFKRTFQMYGFNRQDWETIGNSKRLVAKNGAEFIHIDGIAAEGNLQLAKRLKHMMFTEQQYAIPSSTVRTRAQLTGASQAGSVWGEALRSVALYKSFPVTLMHTHFARSFSGVNIGAIERGRMLSDMLIATTLIGALVIQSKQLLQGKDPIPMWDKDHALKFWTAALLQGGGLGLFGDFAFSDQTRFGQDAVRGLTGPIWGSFLPDTTRLTLGNIQELAQGKDTNAGREFARFLRRYTPGSNVWYARLGLDRLLWDRLDSMLDPDAQKVRRRRERNLKRDFGQRYWWGPGDSEPRAPDLGGVTLP